jgi:hypothetical protein
MMPAPEKYCDQFCACPGPMVSVTGDADCTMRRSATMLLSDVVLMGTESDITLPSITAVFPIGEARSTE